MPFRVPGDPVTVTVEQAAEHVGWSEHKVRAAIDRQAFPHVRDGRRITVPFEALLQWLHEEALRNVRRPESLPAVRNHLRELRPQARPRPRENAKAATTGAAAR